MKNLVSVIVLAAMALISCKKNSNDNNGEVITSISVDKIYSQLGDAAVSVDTIKLVVQWHNTKMVLSGGGIVNIIITALL